MQVNNVNNVSFGARFVTPIDRTLKGIQLGLSRNGKTQQAEKMMEYFSIINNHKPGYKIYATMKRPFMFYITKDNFWSRIPIIGKGRFLANTERCKGNPVELLNDIAKALKSMEQIEKMAKNGSGTIKKAARRKLVGKFDKRIFPDVK